MWICGGYFPRVVSITQNICVACVHVGVSSAESLSFEVIGIPENDTDEEESESSEERILQQELNSPADEKVKLNRVPSYYVKAGQEYACTRAGR